MHSASLTPYQNYNELATCNGFNVQVFETFQYPATHDPVLI